MNLALLQHLVAQPEGAHLEVKEWKNKCDLDLLCRYCCALANEGGGHLVLGVSDRRPRKVVGTRVFPSLGAAIASIRGLVGVDVEAAELVVNGKRVVVFTVPPRPRGAPVLFRGAGYHREGESLVVMPYRALRAILDESDGAAPGAGLDWRALKEQLLEHLGAHGAAGASFAALRRALPQVRRDYLQGLLRELCDEGKARLADEDRGARWVCNEVVAHADPEEDGSEALSAALLRPLLERESRPSHDAEEPADPPAPVVPPQS